jgi:hypothetical protein
MRYTDPSKDSPEDVCLPVTRMHLLAMTGLALLLQGCAPAPTVDEGGAQTGPEQVPELTLNVPDQENCRCTEDGQVDYTFLDKGISALVAGEHIEAVQHFQRYQRLESSPRADWEAGIAIAYDSMLPRSPFYDPQAARKSYEGLKQQQIETDRVHEQVLLMRDALETFAAMQLQVNDLSSDNAILSEDLAKREEALKRLRELTLGQKGARQ